jgi:hypothetical protein
MSGSRPFLQDRSVKDKLWESRAVVSLARLRHNQGRRAPKHAVSSPLFTTGSPRGFDTLDLKEAKTLFDWARVSASLERADGPVAG